MAVTWDQTAFERMYVNPEGTYSRAFWQSFKPGSATDASPRFFKDLWEQRIVPAIGAVTGAQRVLYVGCGLGIGVEQTLDSGFTGGSTWGIDSSTYIQSLWPAQARADVRPKLAALDIRTATAQQLRTLTGINNVRFTVIVTEDMISGYTQAELADTNVAVNPLVACENWLAAGGKIIHLLFTKDGSTPDMTTWAANAQIPQPDGSAIPQPWAGTPIASPGSPAMTMAQWQALRPTPHQFVSMEGI